MNFIRAVFIAFGLLKYSRQLSYDRAVQQPRRYLSADYGHAARLGEGYQLYRCENVSAQRRTLQRQNWASECPAGGGP